MIGLDTRNWSLVDLTGSEFSGGFVPDVNGSMEGFASVPRAESWSFMRGGGALKNLIFFKAFYADRDLKSDQLFVFDMEHPFAALPLTNFTDDSLFLRNITPTVFGPFTAFSSSIGVDDSTQKVYFIDVPHLSIQVLDTAVAVQNGSLAWLAPIVLGPDSTPGSLTWVVGSQPATNPTLAVKVNFRSIEPGAATKTFTVIGGNELDHLLDVHR